MEKCICFLVCLMVNFISAQTKSNDYFSLYKGGEKYLKPIKYILFEIKKDNEALKKEDESKIYFYIKKQRFIFDIKKHKKDTCSIAILKNLKLENAGNLQNEACEFFKKKKGEVEKQKKVTLVYPPAGCQSYFKVYIFEKINDNEVIKYQVDWEYSEF